MEAEMLKDDWLAAALGEIHPRLYPAGTILTGELLARATEAGLVVAPDPMSAPTPSRGRARK
jgi:hypothetical protein